jgi:hypothetical protein
MALAECEPEPKPGYDPNDVLAICLALHSVSMSDVTEREDRNIAELLRMETYLQRRLDNWAACSRLLDAFNSTVKTLVRIALAEWRACPRHPWAKLCDPQLESLAFEYRRLGDRVTERALSAFRAHRHRLAIK